MEEEIEEKEIGERVGGKRRKNGLEKETEGEEERMDGTKEEVGWRNFWNVVRLGNKNRGFWNSLN